jgi:hypothetical protein
VGRGWQSSCCCTLLLTRGWEGVGGRGRVGAGRGRSMPSRLLVGPTLRKGVSIRDKAEGCIGGTAGEARRRRYGCLGSPPLNPPFRDGLSLPPPPTPRLTPRSPCPGSPTHPSTPDSGSASHALPTPLGMTFSLLCPAGSRLRHRQRPLLPAQVLALQLFDHHPGLIAGGVASGDGRSDPPRRCEY